MKIKFLTQEKSAIPTLTKWFYDEWSYLHEKPTYEYFENELHDSLNTNKFPLAILGFENDELVATSSILAHDLDSYNHLTPWLASVYVREDKRGNGLGKEIVLAIEKIAKEIGVKKIYLYATDAQDFYKKFGWISKENSTKNKTPITIMEKMLV